MFKNDFQGGPYVEILSLQGRDATSNWKLGPGVQKIYEKDVKGYVFTLEGTPATNKMQIPRDSKPLTLIQRYLVLQVYLSKGQDFSIELGVCDLSNSKRRIQLSTALREIQITPLHARIPLSVVRKTVWLNLCLDMVSLVGDTWIGQTYRSIDHIVVSANCRVKRIFTMKSQPLDTTDDCELYGYQEAKAGDVDVIPKQVQLAADVPHFTQVLTMNKIKAAERLKNGKTINDQFRPGSMTDLDLNASGNKGNFHIAFGSKVNVPQAESIRRSSRQGPTTNRSTRSTLSRADGSVSSASLQDLRESQDSLGSTAKRSAPPSVKAAMAGQRPGRTGLLLSHAPAADLTQQNPETFSPEEQDVSTAALNGVNHTGLVTPHPPREPSNDRVRRYHRVKSVPNSSTTVHSTKDRIGSAGSAGEEAVDSIATLKASTSFPTAVKTDQSPVRTTADFREGSGDSLRRQALGHNLALVNGKASPVLTDHRGDMRDSLSDVISLLKFEAAEEREEEGHSSDCFSDSSHPAEYEESDDEGSSDTANKFHLFSSRPKEAPFRNISPGLTDHDPSKQHLVKLPRSIRRSTSEILSSRGARLEDDFNRDSTSSDEDDYHRVRPGSRPHSGTSATSSPKARGNNSAGEKRGKNSGGPKASVSPDFKRPAFDPKLYAGDSPANRQGTPPKQTPVRHSRKSLREINPQDSVHYNEPAKSYDHTKYQMAEVTESFEARMFASMKRQQDDELEDVTASTLQGSQAQSALQGPQAHSAFHPRPPLPETKGDKLRPSLHVFSESPYTTSDDDTSFSTWKAPAPNQMAHNYQEEMKSRLSSDTLTSSNPRDWSSVFSPPIGLPSAGDLQGTLEGQFEDLSDAGPSDAHTTAPSASEDEELDLMYDPNLNCYYDPKTLKYYELAS